MQRLSTLLVPTVPICQRSKQWITTALTTLKLIQSSFLFTLLCASLATSTLSSSMLQIDAYVAADTDAYVAADTDAYVAAALISRQLPGILCIKRKQEMILCRELVTDEMANCIVQLHCMTGCDANSGFYGKGKKSVFDKVAKTPIAQQQLSRCGESLDLQEDVQEELFKFTRHVIYGDKTSDTMAEARAAKWKTLKSKSFARLPPDEDSLRQHCLRANYLAYLVRHPTIKQHPSPLEHGWVLIDGHCRPVRHTLPALPTHLPVIQIEKNTDESEDDESTSSESDSSHSDSSDPDSSDSDSSDGIRF